MQTADIQPMKKKASGRPFPPGVSGNPNGRPKIPPELQKYTGITHDKVRRLYEFYADKPLAELKALSKDETLAALDWNIVMSLINPDRFGFALDRSAGKIPDVNHNVNVNIGDPADYEEIPKDALLKLVGEKKE